MKGGKWVLARFFDVVIIRKNLGRKCGNWNLFIGHSLDFIRWLIHSFIHSFIELRWLHSYSHHGPPISLIHSMSNRRLFDISDISTFPIWCYLTPRPNQPIEIDVKWEQFDEWIINLTEWRWCQCWNISIEPYWMQKKNKIK